ncbi:MAG: preprotein translocase subunit SecE [Candidatus Binatia bacterium]
MQVRVLPDPPSHRVGYFMGDWIEKVQDGVRRLTEFFQESWQELKKVHWPSRKETYAATLVVIIVVVLISVYLALVDLGLTKAIQAIVD